MGKVKLISVARIPFSTRRVPFGPSYGITKITIGNTKIVR